MVNASVSCWLSSAPAIVIDQAQDAEPPPADQAERAESFMPRSGRLT